MFHRADLMILGHSFFLFIAPVLTSDVDVLDGRSVPSNIFAALYVCTLLFTFILAFRDKAFECRKLKYRRRLTRDR